MQPSYLSREELQEMSVFFGELIRQILSGEGGELGISNVLGNCRRGSELIDTDRWKGGWGLTL